MGDCNGWVRLRVKVGTAWYGNGKTEGGRMKERDVDRDEMERGRRPTLRLGDR